MTVFARGVYSGWELFSFHSTVMVCAGNYYYVGVNNGRGSFSIHPTAIVCVGNDS